MGLIIIIIIVLFLLSLCVCSLNNSQSNINIENFKQKIKEGFATLADTQVNTIIDQNNKISDDCVSKDCYSLSPLQCLKCGNCGISEKNGIYKCIPGDVYGPLFEDTANSWTYGNSYDKYIYDENIVRRYSPWNKDVKNNIVDLLGLYY